MRHWCLQLRNPRPTFAPAAPDRFPSFHCDGMTFKVLGGKAAYVQAHEAASPIASREWPKHTQLCSVSAPESKGGGAIESKFTARSRHPTSVWHAGDK